MGLRVAKGTQVWNPDCNFCRRDLSSRQTLQDSPKLQHKRDFKKIEIIKETLILKNHSSNEGIPTSAEAPQGNHGWEVERNNRGHHSKRAADLPSRRENFGFGPEGLGFFLSVCPYIIYLSAYLSIHLPILQL